MLFSLQNFTEHMMNMGHVTAVQMVMGDIFPYAAMEFVRCNRLIKCHFTHIFSGTYNMNVSVHTAHSHRVYQTSLNKAFIIYY